MDLHCINHEDKVAVAKCIGCGAGLCRECTEKYNIIVCDRCVGEAAMYEKKAAKKRLICMVVIFALFMLLGVYGTITDTVNLGFERGVRTMLLTPFMSYMFAGVPSGWRAIDKIGINKVMDIILIIPLAGWVLWFVFRIVLSCFLGLVALPIEFIKCLRLLKE